MTAAKTSRPRWPTRRPAAPTVRIGRLQREHIRSFRACLDSVARERRWLAMVKAPSAAEARRYLSSVINQRIPAFVALHGKRVVGGCDVRPYPLEGFRHCGRLGMFVHRDYRGQGIGRQLVERCLAAARRRGLERVELEVYNSNVPAVSLYRHLKFRVEGVKRRARKLDGAYDDVLVMALFLRATVR